MTTIGFSRVSETEVIIVSDSLVSHRPNDTVTPLDTAAPKLLTLTPVYRGLSDGDSGTFERILPPRSSVGIAYTGRVEICLLAYLKASTICNSLTIVPEAINSSKKWLDYELPQVATIVHRMLKDTCESYADGEVFPTGKNIMYVVGFCPHAGRVQLFECPIGYTNGGKVIDFGLRKVDLVVSKPKAIVQGSKLIQEDAMALVELGEFPEKALVDAVTSVLVDPTRLKTVGGALQTAVCTRGGFQITGNTFDAKVDQDTGADNSPKIFGYDYADIRTITGCEFALPAIVTDN
jgi:hypothetical protein